MKKYPITKIMQFSLLIIFIVGCQLVTESETRYKVSMVENDETKLAERVHVTNESIEIVGDSTIAGKASIYRKSDDDGDDGDDDDEEDDDKGISLTLVAEIDALEYEGVKLQANEIRIKGDKAYVGYNTMGETFLGGVEVFDISDDENPSLISSVVFTDTDVNGVAISGSDLYLAASTSDESFATPAILRVIKLKGGKLSDDITNINIPSFAATDVEIFGNDVYVTSGADDGFTTTLNATTYAVTNSFVMDDARGIDSDSGDIAAISGSNGVAGVSAKLITFDKNTGVIQDTFNISGGTIKNSKSTIEVKKDKAILAMGEGGTQLVCLATGSVLKTIAIPVVDGIDPSLTVANSATAYKRSVFMANGEAGIYIAVDDENIDSKGCDASKLEVLGKLKLDLTQSINHIVYRNDLLFVAAGLGGLKVIKVEDSEAEEDGDDSDDDENEDDDASDDDESDD